MARRAWVAVRDDKRDAPVLLTQQGWLIMDSELMNSVAVAQEDTQTCTTETLALNNILFRIFTTDQWH